MGDLVLKTPSGLHEITFKTEITGKIYRDLESVWTKNLDIEQEGKEMKMKGLKGAVMQQWEDLAIQLLVVSIDGSTEKILERVLDMHHEDYLFVREKVQEITGQKKTNS